MVRKSTKIYKKGGLPFQVCRYAMALGFVAGSACSSISQTSADSNTSERQKSRGTNCETAGH
eukprot:4636821-Amphidinium_carterae.1